MEGGVKMGRIIEVEGYRAFYGAMWVGIPSVCVDGEMVGWNVKRGSWLYKPDTRCWYCDGQSYPEEMCRICAVE